jgi:hypothetical protein
VYFPTHETHTVHSLWDPVSIETFRRAARRTTPTIARGVDSSQPRVVAGRTANMQVRGAPYLFALRALCNLRPMQGQQVQASGARSRARHSYNSTKVPAVMSHENELAALLAESENSRHNS